MFRNAGRAPRSRTTIGEMMRSLAVSVAAVALGWASVTAVASAQPAAACDFTLSTPQVVSVAGTAMVAVTMAPAACDAAIPF